MDKWKWQMNMHFEQYEMISIIDGLRKCLNTMNIENASEDNKKNLLAWKRDNTQMAALIASALSQPVVDLVLTYCDTKDIWTSWSVCMNKAVFNE